MEEDDSKSFKVRDLSYDVVILGNNNSLALLECRSSGLSFKALDFSAAEAAPMAGLRTR
jgi:hypothetical protein